MDQGSGRGTKGTTPASVRIGGRGTVTSSSYLDRQQFAGEGDDVGRTVDQLQ
jgi:hypothetical protein